MAAFASPAPGRAEFARVLPAPALPGATLLRARFTGRRFARHFHEGYAIGVVEQGALAFRYRGENVVAPAGALNLTVPGEPHTGQAADGKSWTYRMFYLDAELLRRAARAAGHPRSHAPHFRPGVIEDPLLASRVRALHVAVEGGKEPDLALGTGLTRLLRLWIERHAEDTCAAPAPARAPAALRRVRELIHDRCCENLRLDELAREAELSPWHLARSFAHAFGLAPHEYLIQARIERAKAMLRCGADIAHTALELGFADQSHFTRHFAAHTGLPPGRWRKMVQDARGRRA